MLHARTPYFAWFVSTTGIAIQLPNSLTLRRCNATSTSTSTSTFTGEIHELKQELDTGAIEAKRECLKKIIAAMTIGKDVSMLFPDVVKQINTQDLELKKLVYLYVMNYAKSQPNLAILSVNAFVTV
jgi:vesicle coat complex subunit